MAARRLPCEGELVWRKAPCLRGCQPAMTGSSDPLRQAFGLPPPLGHQGEAFLRALGGGASNAAVRTGGYKIRPYRPAPGFLVGAGFMPARNQVPIPSVVRWCYSP